MIKHKILKVVLLFFWFLPLVAHSQKVDRRLEPLTIEKPYSLQHLLDSVQDNSINLAITDIQDPAESYIDLYYYVFAKLYYDNNSVLKPALLKELKLNLELKVYGKESVGLAPETFEDSFNLSISPKLKYNSKAFFFSKENEAISGLDLLDLDSATIDVDLSNLNAFDSATLSNVIVELIVERGRYFTNSIDTISPQFIINDPIDTSSSLIKNEAVIYWDHAPQPSEYELEIVHLPRDSVSGLSAIDVDFTKGAISVLTKKNFYPLDLIFEEGVLVVRSRVRRPVRNSRNSALLKDIWYYTEWSLPDSINGISTAEPYVLMIDHSSTDKIEKLNWNYQSSLLNNSKVASQTTYFDGTLKPRQSVDIITNEDSISKLNSQYSIDYNPKLYASEIIYDFTGKEIAKIMPAPVLNLKDLIYQDSLSLFGNEKLSRSHLDSLGYDTFPQLNTNSKGAANYYSSDNFALGKDSMLSYIPDANGYVYSRVEYLQDGSGRLKMERGIGESTAKDETKNTRYSYAKPTPSELERLFGSNVGLASFYKKNITVDPNGVSNINYIDQFDRVIATSLDGEPLSRANMIDISVDTSILSDDLMNTGAEKYNNSNGGYEMSYPIFVTATQEYSFEYGVDLNQFIKCGGTVCFECNYEVVFQIIDDNNQLVIEAKDSIVNIDPDNCTSINYQLDTLTFKLNSNDTIINNSIQVELAAQKQYTIIKKFRSIDFKSELIADAYMDSLNCGFNTLQYYQSAELDSANFEECQMSYEDNTIGPCEEIENRLLSDFSYPYGSLVLTADSTDSIPDFIYDTLLHISGCHEIDTMELDEFKIRFNSFFGLSETPTFEDYHPVFLDFLIKFHPTYCQLPLCESYFKDEQSIFYEELLSESSTVYEFDSLIALYGIKDPDDSVHVKPPNIIWSEHYGLGDDLSNPILLIQYDTLIRSILHTGLIRYYTDDYLGLDTNMYYDVNLLPDLRNCSDWKKLDSDHLVQFVLSYFTNFPGCQDTTAASIEDLAKALADSTDKNSEWEFYKMFYLSARKQLFEDLISSAVCFTPFYDTLYDTGGYDTLINFNDSIPTCLVPDTTTDYRFPWHNDTAALHYRNYAHFTGELSANAQFAQNSEYSAVIDSLTNNLDINEIVATTVYDLLIADSCILQSDSVTFVNSLVVDSFICNPYHYLDTMLGGNLLQCNPYFINLSSELSDIKRYFTDSLGNPLFNCLDTIQAYYNFSDFSDAHSEFIFQMGSIIGVPRIQDPKFLSINDTIQKLYKNWMNHKLSLNLSIYDYFELSSAFVLNNDTNVFGDTLEWNETGFMADVREAILAFPDTNYWELNSTEIIEMLNTELVNFSDTINQDTVYMSLGEVNMSNNQYDLFYLKTNSNHFNQLRDTLNILYIFLREEDNARYDFEDSLQIENARRIDIDQYEHVSNSNRDFGVLNLLIDRAYQFSDGTIWARTLKKSDSTYFKDYYFHYKPLNEEFLFSEVDSAYNSTYVGAPFDSLTPLIYQEAVNYVKLNIKSLDYELVVSSSHPFFQANNLGKVMLGNYKGRGFYPFDPSCEQLKYEEAIRLAQLKYNQYMNEIRSSFISDYSLFCNNQTLNKAFEYQYLNMSYGSSEKQFTLYYYDQAGNLVKTVPPAGVDKSFTYNSATKQHIENYRNGIGSPVFPNHQKETSYKYNADNQIIRQTTPNGGTSYFWYDQAGRLVLSQNAKQAPTHAFSYTLYDNLSRVYESGEVELNDLAGKDWEEIHAFIVLDILDGNPLELFQLIHDNARNDVSRTYYDSTILSVSNYIFDQHNTRSRISTVAFYEQFDSTKSHSNWDYAIHYSYDPQGNVSTLVNDYYQNGMLPEVETRFKRVDYEYNVLSGNVLAVYYQLGHDDAFYHQYEYDAENRITNVMTSSDGVVWDEDATYKYYPHGPLARTELGAYKVQGIDFAYTLEGFLKSVNSGHHITDMGNDDDKTNIFGTDAFGFALEYNQFDYSPIGSSHTHFIKPLSPSDHSDLYNGNIAAITMHRGDSTFGKKYRYDPINRLRSFNEYALNLDTLGWGSGLTNGYSTYYEYDEDGNITDLHRYSGEASDLMDYMHYNYISGKDQLSSVDDTVSSESFANDIDQQVSSNYTYDEIGNLVADSVEGISQIRWNPNGKVDRILRYNPSKEKADLYFEYDPLGNRIKKKVHFNEDGKSYFQVTYYVRDAQGNVLSTYEERNCDLLSGDDTLGNYFYQYTESYTYYTNQAMSQMDEISVIEFLYANFSKKSELLEEAHLNLSQITGIRDTILADLIVSEYLSLYPQSDWRVINNSPFFYADYLYNNDFSNFVDLVNFKDEAYIEYLIESDSVQTFYGLYDNLFNTNYGNAEQFGNASEEYSILSAFAQNLIDTDTNKYKDLFDLNAAEFSNVIQAYGDPSSAVSYLNDLFNDFNEELATQNSGQIAYYTRMIKPYLLTCNFESGHLDVFLDPLDFANIHSSNIWMSAPEIDYLMNFAYILQGNMNSIDYSSSFDIDSLYGHSPLSNTLVYAKDTFGIFLKYLIHEDYANDVMKNPILSTLTDIVLSDWDIYGDTSTVKDFAKQALLSQVNDSSINAALINNSDTTINQLSQTETTTQLSYYYKKYHPIEVLRQNYFYDSLTTAFSGITHYTPFEYAQELEDKLNVSFNNQTACSADSLYTIPRSFMLYGSSRLGILQANLLENKNDNYFQRELGRKSYELSDHLGNVVATVSDRRIHPQELLTSGQHNVDTTLGFMAEVTGRYDYYPFGMEIMERSGSFSEIDYTTNTTEIIYQGLFRDSSAYEIVPMVYSNGNPKTLDSLFCVFDTNLYGQTYVDSLRIDQYWEHQAWHGKHKIEFKVHLDIAEVIGNLQQNAVYEIEFLFSSLQRYVFGVSPENGEETIPGNSSPSQSELLSAQEKYLTFSYSGHELDSLASNGVVEFHLRASWGQTAPWDRFIAVKDIKITKIENHTTVPLAKRMDQAYRYGFQGMERDDELSGSGNAYNTKFRGYDPRLGRWKSIDPLVSYFPWQSPYNGMDNNPIALSDPLGDSTMYFSTLGELLHQSNDGLENAVVSIEDDQLDAFNNALSLAENGSSDDVNKGLRSFGTGYAIDDFKAFFNENRYNQAEGWDDGYYNEHKTFLYMKDGLIRPGKENYPGDVLNADGNPLGDSPLGDLHFHPNAGKSKDIYGNLFAHKPSGPDGGNSSSWYYSLSPFHFDVVITDKYTYFINNVNHKGPDNRGIVVPTKRTFENGTTPLKFKNYYNAWFE